MTDTYRLAEKNIQVVSLFEAVHRYCRDYRCDAPPDFAVEIRPEDIAFERERSAREDRTEGRAEKPYADEYLELLAVYRKIAERMPDYDTILFHGSCVAVDGAAYLFAAKSGTGKSTHARLWRELLGERAVMVNDDKPLIRITEEGPLVCGTPWNGKHRLGANLAVPLRALCVLERAEENRIVPLTPEEARMPLLQQTYRPMDPAALGKTLELLDRLAGSVKLYRLGCNMDPEAARLSYETMKG